MFVKVEEEELKFLIRKLKPVERDLYYVYKLECYRARGICRIPLHKLWKTYGFKSYTSLIRIRARLEAAGFIVYDKEAETVACLNPHTDKKSVSKGGKSTGNDDDDTDKKSADTDKKSILGETDTDKKSASGETDSDKKSVSGEIILTKSQHDTDKKSADSTGTEVANNDLNLKQESRDLNLKREGEEEFALALTEAELLDLLPQFPPIDIYRFFFPNYQLSAKEKGIILSRVTDRSAYIKALYFWWSNGYKQESIGKQCTKHDEIIKEEGKKNVAGIQPARNGHHSGNGYKSAGEKRTESAINGHRTIEQIRALNEARRRERV